MKKFLSGCAALLCTALVACGGNTTGATNVTDSTAELGFQGHCDPGDAGKAYVEWRIQGGSTWERQYGADVLPDGPDAGSDPDPCTTRIPASGDAAGSFDVHGLFPDTTYEYRVGFRFNNNSEVYTDSDGGINSGNAYSTFTTDEPQFTAGVVTGVGIDSADATALSSLDPKIVRVEADLADNPNVAGAVQTRMDNAVQQAADRNVRVLLLADFAGRIPTQAEAQNLANWASRYGPGGTYWASHTGDAFAPTQIEFGNETSYGYQYGDSFSDPSYAARAQTYAHRVVQAVNAIGLTGRPVEVLAQADHGGSGSANWVNNMDTAEPNLDTYVGGWTVHPYGNQTMWRDKLDKVVSQTAAVGWSSKVPIDITEYGISTDDGNTLYGACSSGHEGCSAQGGGNSATETYAQAATDITAAANDIKSRYAGRIEDFTVYRIRDLATHNTKRCNSNSQSCREDFFGVLQNGGADKPSFTAAVKALWNTSLSARPVVRNQSGGTAASLRVGSSGGAQLPLKGVSVWGLPDHIAINSGTGTQHWLREYNNRAAIAAQVKNWGGNFIRLRVLAGDYNDAPNANTASLTKAQYIQHVKDWRDAAAAQGLYLLVTGWDALDGDHEDAGWPGTASDYDQLFSDIYAALGNDEKVFYEPTNEPNGVTFAQWDTNMRHTIAHFRDTIGYKGVLVIDPIWWANSGTGGQGYDDGYYSGLETYDAARTGMGGQHQLIFAKHDYAPQYSGKVWNATSWSNAAGGAQIKHVIFESEYGNYNGDPSTVSDSWSAAASSFFRSRFSSQETYAGAGAFLWGPWTDANSITGTDDVTPVSPWGTTVRDNLLAP